MVSRYSFHLIVRVKEKKNRGEMRRNFLGLMAERFKTCKVLEVGSVKLISAKDHVE